MNALLICPICETEYRPGTAACADCGTPLVSPAAYREAFEPLPFAPELVPIRTETTRWIKRLAEHLGRAGIRCHVRPERVTFTADVGRTYYHTLYVRPEHEAAARRLDYLLLGEAREPLAEDTGAACPACGAVRDPEATACPDCGLSFEPDVP